MGFNVIPEKIVWYQYFSERPKTITINVSTPNRPNLKPSWKIAEEMEAKLQMNSPIRQINVEENMKNSTISAFAEHDNLQMSMPRVGSKSTLNNDISTIHSMNMLAESMVSM